MFIESFRAHQRFFCTNKAPSFLSRLCIFFILLLIVSTICYDADLSDTNDPPVMVSQLPDILYPSGDEITLIEIVKYTIGLPIIYKEFSLNRAPPV
jgi:hypothetical protein